MIGFDRHSFADCLLSQLVYCIYVTGFPVIATVSTGRLKKRTHTTTRSLAKLYLPGTSTFPRHFIQSEQYIVLSSLTSSRPLLPHDHHIRHSLIYAAGDLEFALLP